jgi:succinate dehydrogenase hydrophobic anchor subunit
MVKPQNELLYIITFDLYTLYKTLCDATEHNLSVSYFRSIWTLLLLLNTFWHEWSGLVTLCKELLYNTCSELYTVLVIFLMQSNTISKFLTFFSSGLYFYCWTRFDTNGHAS